MKRHLDLKHKKIIASVFNKHRIDVSDDNLNALYSSIEDGWDFWVWDQATHTPMGRVEILNEIGRLHRMLKSLPYPVVEVLDDCSITTPTYEQIETLPSHKKLFDEIYDADWGGPPGCSHFDLALNILTESCAVAMENGGPCWTGHKDAIDEHSTKRGRPNRDADKKLLRELASAFYKATGKKPTTTPSGAFHDYVCAVFSIIDPHRPGEISRKLLDQVLIPKSINKS
jgi:hypothetical protein